MWLGLVICERCLLIQRDRVARIMVTNFDEQEYYKGCAHCGYPLARAYLH